VNYFKCFDKLDCEGILPFYGLQVKQQLSLCCMCRYIVRLCWLTCLLRSGCCPCTAIPVLRYRYS